MFGVVLVGVQKFKFKLFTGIEAKIQAFNLGLFDTFARWTNGWHLLSGQSAKCFSYQMWLTINHRFPSGRLHNVGGVTRKRQLDDKHTLT